MVFITGPGPVTCVGCAAGRLTTVAAGRPGVFETADAAVARPVAAVIDPALDTLVAAGFPGVGIVCQASAGPIAAIGVIAFAAGLISAGRAASGIAVIAATA